MITLFYYLVRCKVIMDYNHEMFAYDALIRVGCFAADWIAFMIFLNIVKDILHWSRRWWVR